MVFISYIYLFVFLASVLNSFKVSFGVVEGKSFTPSSQDLPLWSKTTYTGWVLRPWKDGARNPTPASPSHRGAAVPACRASGVKSIPAFCLELGLVWMAMVTHSLRSAATGLRSLVLCSGFYPCSMHQLSSGVLVPEESQAEAWVITPAPSCFSQQLSDSISPWEACRYF